MKRADCLIHGKVIIDLVLQINKCVGLVLREFLSVVDLWKYMAYCYKQSINF